MTYVSLVAATVGSILLVVSPLTRRHSSTLAGAIADHAVLPIWTVRIIGPVLPVVEVVVGFAGILSVFGILESSSARASLGALLALYVAYGLYSLTALWRASAELVGCGCGDQSLRSGWVAGRALCLGLGAGVAVVTVPSFSGLRAADMAVLLVAVMALAVVTWYLPSSMDRLPTSFSAEQWRTASS
jgi:hypothetical protein